MLAFLATAGTIEPLSSRRSLRQRRDRRLGRTASLGSYGVYSSYDADSGFGAGSDWLSNLFGKGGGSDMYQDGSPSDWWGQGGDSSYSYGRCAPPATLTCAT